jgi:hypothetical protein
LLAYCKAEFELSKLSADKEHSKREHYIAAGIPREQWGLPDPPEGLLYLWGYFLKLSNRRQSGMGVNPITYTELDGFMRLSKVSLEAWEVDLIFALDDVARRAAQ